jgi:hypothetical protein
MSKQSGHIEDELIVLVRDHIGLEGLEHVPIEWNHAAQTNRKVRRRQGGWNTEVVFLSEIVNLNFECAGLLD